MKKLIFTVLNITLSLSWLAAQNPDTSLELVPLRETVISANRQSQSRSAVAQQVTVLRQATIEAANTQSTAELLGNQAGIFVQKSQQGGGSPVIRGFEASRILLVVDGIRLNNAIYRAGHLQNVITLDHAALERAEILFGPASTVYGSDALGGAICFFTKNPELAAAGENFRFGGNAYARYGTINREKTIHTDFSLGGRRAGSLSSFTFSDFGDLRMGKSNTFSPAFGKRLYYVERIDGRDSLVSNADPYLQKFSGYRQYDFLEKLVLRPSENSTHTLNIQYSTSSNIPRYDRLTDPGSSGNGLASAEWYYGPQNRLLAAYSLGLNELGWFNGGMRITASYQNIEESRHNRNFGNARRTDRIERVQVAGLQTDASRNWARQILRIGADAQYNDVFSRASRFNIADASVTPASTRYPDGDNRVIHAAVYATHQWQCTEKETLVFSEGVRLGYSSLEANFESREFFPFPYRQAKQSSPVYSGSLGAVWNGAPGWHLAFNASSGFRMPNIDDLAKVFDSQAGSVLVPNPDIKPEKTFNLELNLTHRLTDRIRWENVVWATALRDAIVTDIFQFNGQDSVEYDGVLSRVLANQNKRKANLWGFYSGIEADISASVAAYGSASYTRGRVRKTEGQDTPLDHIPPVFGRAGVRWHLPRVSVESFVVFHGKKSLNEYNLEGEDNLQYAPADGMPGWMTLNLRGSCRLHRLVSLQAGVDNLLDTQYRVFASGINGPGRNFWLTLRLRFA